MTDSHPNFRWRAVIVTTLLPALLFAIGEGAIVPMIPVVASDLGASLASAGLVSAMLLVGHLAGDIPSGVLVARIGERTAMIGAAAVSSLGAVLAFVAWNPWVLGAGVLVIGVAAAVFALARHAFLTSFVPYAYRARALSTLGGTHRLGMFVGPFLTAGVIQLTGRTEVVFWILIVAAAAAALVLVVLRDPESIFGTPPRRRGGHHAGEDEVSREASGLFRTLAAKRSVLVTVGLGASILSALRASRLVILPLWGVSIGLGETTIALVIGISGAIDFGLFYLGGSLMDRFGRLWVAVPALIGLAAAHLVLAFTHDVTGREVWFVVIAIVLGLANGMSSGILMTIGADLADRRDPAPFLGAWRFTNDAGSAATPLVIAGVTAVASISVAAGVVGVLGVLGAIVMRVALPRHLPPHRR